MMLFYSQTNKFGHPPPQKKRQQRRRDTNGRDMATRTCVCLHQQRVTWNFTRSRLSDLAQSNPFVKNNYLIIVAFSHPHFSICDISYTKESTLSFHARATRFKVDCIYI